MIPDVLPKLLIEIRDDPAVAAIVGTRVRGFEPAPAMPRAPPYQAFVVLGELSAVRIGRRPGPAVHDGRARATH